MEGLIYMDYWIFFIGMILAYASGTIVGIIGKRRKWTETQILIGITVAFFVVVVVGAAIIQIYNL